MPLRMDRPQFWVWSAMVVGLFLRIHCLFHPYLWLDEYVTLWSIRGATYAQMLERSAQWTASGPLFVLCYRISCDLVGDVELGLKLPGVIGGTAAIWMAWWSARKLFDRDDVAAVAAWLVAVGPQFIHFAQEARPYMIGSVLLLATIGFLASWLRFGRWLDLAAIVALSLAAVGFQLLAALALPAQNLVVFVVGLRRRWGIRRWLEWTASQLAVIAGLWFAGSQFQSLSHRQGSMILETSLPMPTRQSLDHSLWGQFQVEATVLLVGIGMWWCARRFSTTDLAKAWRQHGSAVCIAGALYWIPTASLSVLTSLRMIDCWPRYYFLFHPGFMLALAWLVAGAFPRNLSAVLLGAVLAASISQFNIVEGMLSCRLNSAWRDFPQAEQLLQRKFDGNDLLLTRSGLIESNHPQFLENSEGASYLKCFCEARNGPIAAEHWALPFSVESRASHEYMERLFSERIVHRRDFWLANIGVSDFDYNSWIVSHFGDTFHKADELVFPMISFSHYVRATP